MTCKECNCCHLGWFKSKPNAYVCTGVRHPFVINDINVSCTEYEDRRARRVTTKYRKKPVVIEAFKLGVDNIPDWFMDKVSSNEIFLLNSGGANIITLEGVMHADKGDFIIKGVEGECYPCDPDIFEKTYEAVFDEKGVTYDRKI